jgi:hypothetical protein
MYDPAGTTAGSTAGRQYRNRAGKCRQYSSQARRYRWYSS